MVSPLPSPSHFDEVDLASTPQHFPTTLPIRPGKSKSYLGTLLRKRKLRIIICILAFLLAMGGTVIAALSITRSMQRINAGQAALSSNTPTAPTPGASTLTTAAPKSVVTQTTMVTMVSTVTGVISIPVTQLQSTVYAVATGTRCDGIIAGTATVCASSVAQCDGLIVGNTVTCASSVAGQLDKIVAGQQGKDAE